MSPTHLLLWDIDGTLLSTARAGVHALEQAAREVFGAEPDIQALPTGGLTDAQVALAVARSVGVEADEPLAMRFLAVYERELPAALPRRAGQVLPGVRELLEDLAADARVASLLLTGNTRAGAAAKLAHYALGDLISEGAFCVDTRPREEIARRAIALARERGVIDVDRTFVIGDTPHDVACAEAIGARAIAVATGGYGVEELRESGAWVVLERLPAPAQFRELVGL